MDSSLFVVSSRLFCSAWLNWILAQASQALPLRDLASIGDFMYADSNCVILDNSVYVVYFLEVSCPQSWRESLVWFDVPWALSVAEDVASFLCERNSEVSFVAKDLCILFGHNLVTLLLSITITLQFSEIPLLEISFVLPQIASKAFFHVWWETHYD